MIGEPDSDDHQLSMTTAPGAACFVRRSWKPCTMVGSLRSPARKSALKVLSPPRSPISLKYLLSGSSLRIARRAVGAVKSTLTLFRSMIRQKVPASGVPTGLPSNMTVVAPTSSGAYSMYECPTTQPMSEAQNMTSPGP